MSSSLNIGNLRKAESNTISVSATTIALIGIGLLICTLLSTFYISTIISAALLVCYLIYLIRREPRFFIKYFLVVYGCLLSIAGVLACELSNVYVVELGVTTQFSGSAPLCILSKWVFLVSLVFFDNMFGVEDGFTSSPAFEVVQKKFLPFASCLVAGIYVVMFVHVLQNPAFMLGIDRFGYASYYFSGIWRILNGFSGYLFLVSLVAIKQGNKKSGWIGIVAYFLYMVWTGNKFGSYFMVVGMFALAFYDRVLELDTRRISQALILLLIAGIALLGGSVVLHDFSNSSLTGIEFLSQRMAQQGELWWSTYSNYSPGIMLDDFGEELAAIADGRQAISESVGSDVGIYKIMYLNAPTSMVDAKLISGSRYTEGADASAFLYFGMIGPVVLSFISALFISILINLLVNLFHSCSYIEAILALWLYSAVQTFRSMFLFASLINASTIFSAAFLLVGRISGDRGKSVRRRIEREEL